MMPFWFKSSLLFIRNGCIHCAIYTQSSQNNHSKRCTQTARLWQWFVKHTNSMNRHLFMYHSMTCLNTGVPDLLPHRGNKASYLSRICLTVLQASGVLLSQIYYKVHSLSHSLYHGNLWSFLSTLLNPIFLSSWPFWLPTYWSAQHLHLNFFFLWSDPNLSSSSLYFLARHNKQTL